MINGFNAIPYHCTQLLNIGLNTEVKVTCYQIHFYGCRINNRAICRIAINGYCVLFLFHTTAYLYDLKICDTDYQYVTDLIFQHSRLMSSDCSYTFE